VNRTIVTFTAVVALTLAACTTEDTRGWSDEAFRDLTGYCQATTDIRNCASVLISIRAGQLGNCSAEATYRIIDHLVANANAEDQAEALGDFLDDVLRPTGDCLPSPIPDDE